MLGELLDQRLSKLRGTPWEVARVLAVAQRDLPEAVLQVASGIEEPLLVETLRELAEQRLLTSTDAGTVRLGHPLLAEAVRRRLLPADVAQTSRRLAEAIAPADWASPGEVAVLWQAAGEASQELVWRLRAARQAQRQRALSAAGDHWVRALDLWPEDRGPVDTPPTTRPTTRYEAYTEAMDALWASGRLADEESMVSRAMAESDGFDDLEQADLLLYGGRAAGRRFERLEAVHLLQRAVTLYRTHAPAMGLVRALDELANQFGWVGQDSEALAALEEASAVLVDLGEQPRRHDGLLGWQEGVMGRLPAGIERVAAAARRKPVEPEPTVELQIAMQHTDLLLMACGPPEEVTRAAAHGLETAQRWRLETPSRATVLVNVSMAWRRAGRPTAAARWLDDDAFSATEGGMRLLAIERAAIDVALGELDRCRERLDAVPPEHLFQPGDTVTRAWLDVWQGRSEDTRRALGAVLVETVLELSPGEVGPVLALAARAGADAAEAAAAGTTARRSAGDELVALHRGLLRDPFGPYGVPADLCAQPAWRAELARLTGGATVEHWLEAAASYDRAGWPHDAAYCRWRGAQLALRHGQGTAAQRLLARAARDAREHVPLSRLVAATGAYAQGRDRG